MMIRTSHRRLLILACLLLVVAAWSLLRSTWWSKPAIDETAFESVLMTLKLDDRPFSAELLESQLLKIEGWDQVVFCAPYRTTDELLSAGIRDRSLARELADISGWVEAWHLVAIDSHDRILCHFTVSLGADSRPHKAVIVFKRR